MDRLPHVIIRSADATERGVQYGQQARELILRALDGYHRHFQVKVGREWEEIKRKSHLYIPLLEANFPQELAEARGIAQGAGVGEDDILALNCRYEILKLKLDEYNECTTAAVLPEATGTKDVYMVQNWDYRPWVEEHAVIISIDDCAGTRIVGLTEAGQLLRNGMNNHGVGLCANNLTSVFDTGDVGTPVTFIRRKALASCDYAQVCQSIVETLRTVSCNFMVASAAGKAADLETTPERTFILSPENGIVTHANHMVVGAQFCTNKGTKFRDQVLRKLLDARRGSIDVPYLMECMKNHEQFPGAKTTTCLEAVCTHVPCEDYDTDQTWKTIASAVYDLTNGVAYICKGNPCQGVYESYVV